MKIFPLLLASALSLPAIAQDSQPASQPAPQEPEVLELGDQLPESFALPNLDGDVHHGTNFDERITVVTFWSLQCPIMKGWEPTFTEIAAAYGDRVTFLMVNSNEGNGEIADGEPANDEDKPYQTIRDYLAEKELPHEVLIDHDSVVADLLAARTTPHVYVFDGERRLVFRGAPDNDPRRNKGDEAEQHLQPVLDALLAGEEVEAQRDPAARLFDQASTQGPLRTLGLLLLLLGTTGCGASSVEIVDLDGAEAAIEARKGQPLLVNFWAMWCGPCVAELPELIAIGREMRAEGGEVLGICAELWSVSANLEDTMAKMPTFIDSSGIDYPILVLDEEDAVTASERFDMLGGLPETIAIDAEGNVVGRHQGRASAAELRALADKAFGR